MQDTAQKQSAKKKDKPDWRSAAEAYLRGEDGSEHRLTSLSAEHQASALGLLAVRMSKTTGITVEGADRLMKLLPDSPRQFALAVGAAMLGGGGHEAAEKYLYDGAKALELEALHADLSKGVSPEKRFSVLEVVARIPLLDRARGSVLELTASWLRDRHDRKTWSSTPQEIARLNELLCRGFRDTLATERAGSFWKAYTQFVSPKSLASSPDWRGLTSDIATGGFPGNLSDSDRKVIATYIEEFREVMRGPSPEGNPASEDPDLAPSPAPAPLADLPDSRDVPVAGGAEERPGYLSRLRAGRAGLEKLKGLLEEAEQEHKLHQAVRTECDRARREIEALAKRAADLAEESESYKRKVEEQEVRFRAREEQRIQLEAALRLAQGEATRFRDLLGKRDMDLSRSAQTAEELRKSLSGAQDESEQLRAERDAIKREATQLREDRDRIASEHDKNVDAERRLTTVGVLAEIRNRIGNVVSLQWDSAFRLATTDDEREALELLKRRLFEITRGIGS